MRQLRRRWRGSGEMESVATPDDLRALSDAELAARASADHARGRAAFAEIYERHIARVYQFCYLRAGNRQDAEDLTARVFARALAAIDRYEERGVPLSAWLFRIARNLALNERRDRGRRRLIPFDEEIAQSLAASDAPEERAEASEERERLLAAIARLPFWSQQLLILKFDRECSNAEIGAALGRSESAIKSLYFRTLRALRRELGAGARNGRQNQRSERNGARRRRRI